MNTTEDRQPASEAQSPRIGVALSGGGYRAAAFALGAMLYLADAGLLPTVRAVSSVSGGSITNAFGAWIVFPDNTADVVGAHWDRATPLLRILAHRDLLVPRSIFMRIVTPVLAAIAAVIVVGAVTGVRSGMMIGVVLFAVIVSLLSYISYLRLGVYAGIRLQRWLMEFGPVDAPSRLRLRLTPIVTAMVLFITFRPRRARKALRSYSDGEEYSGPNRPLLTSIRCGFAPIFCCTDLSSGTHFYISNRFVSAATVSSAPQEVSMAGGLPSRMAISRAVIASAAFPGVFQPIMIDSSEHGLPRHAGSVPRKYRLADGGLYDNLGFTFYKQWQERQLGQSLLNDLGELPDLYLFVSGGLPAIVGSDWLGPLGSFRRAMTVMHEANSRSRHEQAREFLSLRRGALVGIGDDPWEIAARGPKDEWKATAADALGHLSKGRLPLDETWWKSTSQQFSRAVRTGLRALGDEDTSRLVLHGYAVTLAHLTAMFGFAVPQTLPTLETISQCCAER